MDLPLLAPAPAGPTPARRRVLSRRVRLLVAATITYNVVEAVVAISAGTIASSTALIGFGLDSVIEVSSAAAVAWQFAGRDPEAREGVALRIIAVSFFALAAYVTVESVRALVGGTEAGHSPVGLVLAALSLAIMPVLSYAQRRAGRELGSRSAVADSKQTLLCTYLSAVLLVGLGLNSLLGWSWADPVAALVIAAVAVREGREAWRGDTCCAVPLTAPDADTAAGGPGDGGGDPCGCRPGCSCCSTGTT
ncbi:cation transporter [Micromonospora okii]|uniref:cation transporter n=1 Tax=Micromonospora okii TaxID=1182970 RepID=UPI001E39517F|nr:cation transporter [Micromonospora okii]